MTDEGGSKPTPLDLATEEIIVKLAKAEDEKESLKAQVKTLTEQLGNVNLLLERTTRAEIIKDLRDMGLNYSVDRFAPIATDELKRMRSYVKDIEPTSFLAAADAGGTRKSVADKLDELYEGAKWRR